MKALAIFSFLFFAFTMQTMAQNDAARKELHELLEDRKQKIDTYSVSLEKHSGIFGNKTKNDMRKSQEVLIDIVKTDNRIISTLYRVVDFRTFEKANMNYDVQKKDESLNSLRRATDTLSKQLDVLKNSNHTLQSKSTRLQWLLYILSLLSIWTVIRLWRKFKAQSQSKF